MIRKLTLDAQQSTISLTTEIWDNFAKVIEEIDANLTIPDSYKEFMFENNGGSFVEYILKDTPAGDLVVSSFYPWDKNREISLNVVLENSEEINAGFLPFADDPGGNYYLLNLNQEGNGQVYYWLHDSEFENGDDKVLLFDTFVNFLNSLQPEN